MGKRALRRKLRSIKLTTPQKIIGAFAVIGAVLWWVVEQLAGNAVVSYIYKPVARYLALVFEWSINHPGQISIVIFFIPMSYLVYQFIRDTRPLKELPVIIESRNNKTGAIFITNHTGDDLFGCTVSVVRVDNREIRHQHLEWYMHGVEADVKNGGNEFLNLQELRRVLVVGRDNDRRPIYDEKLHHVELFFRANTLKQETVSMSMWIPATIKNVGTDEAGQLVYRVFADKVETAHPDFGG